MALRRVDRATCMRLLQAAINNTSQASSGRASSTVVYDHNDPKSKIGTREVVGFGYNGGLNYADRRDYPLPALRFREDTNEILAVREKEKGHWSKMTIEEKKVLYRASFCQTFSEFSAPTGEWKFHLASVIASIACSCWIYMAMKAFVFPPLLDSYSPENQALQLRTIIELQMNPIEGIASKYDYEKGRWK